MELFDIFQHKKIKKLGYVEIEDEQNEDKGTVKGYKNNFELEDNLEEMYETQKQKKQYKLEKMKESKNKKKKNVNLSEDKLQCQQMSEEEDAPGFEVVKESEVKPEVLSKKWFERGLFQELGVGTDEKFENPLRKTMEGKPKK